MEAENKLSPELQTLLENEARLLYPLKVASNHWHNDRMELCRGAHLKGAQSDIAKRIAMENYISIEALCLDNSWPLVDVLRKLTHATDVLLHEKDYDAHGWEEIQKCWERGKEIIAILEQTPPPKVISIEEHTNISNELKESNRKLQFMIDNGLGYSDMHNDI